MPDKTYTANRLRRYYQREISIEQLIDGINTTILDLEEGDGIEIQVAELNQFEVIDRVEDDEFKVDFIAKYKLIQNIGRFGRVTTKI